MEQVSKSFEVAVPPKAAYARWSHFEEFPNFMEDVHEVRQVRRGLVHWRASIAGKEKEWDSEITEDIPERVIAWRSVSGAPNAGRVTFEPVGEDRTRIHVQMEYEPESALEKVGDALGLVSRKIDKTVEDFKHYLEGGGTRT
jgi:uncharacterized membrane protein